MSQTAAMPTQIKTNVLRTLGVITEVGLQARLLGCDEDLIARIVGPECAVAIADRAAAFVDLGGLGRELEGDAATVAASSEFGR